MSGVALSVNLNKYALLRNSRGHDAPSLTWAAAEVLAAGAHGITLHPRMDQRHVRFADVPEMALWLAEHHQGVELNVECEDHPYLLEMALDLRPAQVTLVPVDPGEVTSSHGWQMPTAARRLAPTVARLREAGVRVSAFVDPDPTVPAQLARIGVQRVELYTGPFAWAWGTPDEEEQTRILHATAAAAVAAGLEVNAGHDLDRHNLAGLRGMPGLREVSIGHAQICRALEVGTTTAVQELLAALG
jgi:pyridoxine 5-phosphate synthase